MILDLPSADTSLNTGLMLAAKAAASGKQAKAQPAPATTYSSLDAICADPVTFHAFITNMRRNAQAEAELTRLIDSMV